MTYSRINPKLLDGFKATSALTKLEEPKYALTIDPFVDGGAVHWTGFQNYFSRKEKTASYTAAANGGAGAIDINVSESGFTPLGVVGFTTNNNSVLVQHITFTSNTNVRVYVKNVSGSSISNTLALTVLYVRA